MLRTQLWFRGRAGRIYALSDFLTFLFKGRRGLIAGMYLRNSGSTCWDPLAGSSEDKLGGLATFQLSYMPCRWVAGDLEVRKSLWMQSSLGGISAQLQLWQGWEAPSP